MRSKEKRLQLDPETGATILVPVLWYCPACGYTVRQAVEPTGCSRCKSSDIRRAGNEQVPDYYFWTEPREDGTWVIMRKPRNGEPEEMPVGPFKTRGEAEAYLDE